ncbi:TetR/AcrR family transcriptional regulator [Corynebacterium fournieri]|uniref:TetR/AcrR family transcriptional regulator n=1 Tax=Corynebacterium fournieri TaxID=1852390 RepID=UPI000A2F37C9|nr:TetR/AcrR family transcriptional regulator [Corynebacterium fournieri]WJY96476.1 division inhibitor protein [Corynebacterium fournieri]
MRADARAKRDQIITAALVQIGSRPSSEITLEGIAADAGVGIATLYRHFPTRAALYDACAIVFLDRIETLLDATLDGFEEDPVARFESFVWTLVESGVGILAAALAADSSTGGVVERRDAFMDKVQLLIDAAAPHGIIAPGQSPMQLATELIVATRPLAAPLAGILPDVRDRLVRHLMVGWRTTA